MDSFSHFHPLAEQSLCGFATFCLVTKKKHPRGILRLWIEFDSKKRTQPFVTRGSFSRGGFLRWTYEWWSPKSQHNFRRVWCVLENFVSTTWAREDCLTDVEDVSAVLQFRMMIPIGYGEKLMKNDERTSLYINCFCFVVYFMWNSVKQGRNWEGVLSGQFDCRKDRFGKGTCMTLSRCLNCLTP